MTEKRGVLLVLFMNALLVLLVFPFIIVWQGPNLGLKRMHDDWQTHQEAVAELERKLDDYITTFPLFQQLQHRCVTRYSGVSCPECGDMKMAYEFLSRGVNYLLQREFLPWTREHHDMIFCANYSTSRIKWFW